LRDYFFINHPKCMLILIKSLIKGQPRKFILQKGYRSNTLEKGNSTVPIFIETEQVCMR
jgi:hypothetical protein